MNLNLFLFISILIGYCQCNSLYSKVGEFCSSNGLTYLTISSKHLKNNEVLKLTKEIQSHNLMSKGIPIEDIPNNQRFYSDALILLVENEDLKDKDKFQEYLKLIQSTTAIKRSLIVFTSSLSEDQKVLLMEHIQRIEDHAMFQVMYQSENEDQIEYHQVISIKHGGAVINPLTLNEHGKMVEDYNLQVIDDVKYLHDLNNCKDVFLRE